MPEAHLRATVELTVSCSGRLGEGMQEQGGAQGVTRFGGHLCLRTSATAGQDGISTACARWPGRRCFCRLGRWWDRRRQLGWSRRLGKPAPSDPTREHRRSSAILGTNQVSPTYLRGRGHARVLMNHSLSSEKPPHPSSVPYGAVAISASQNRKSGSPASSGCSCSTTLPRRAGSTEHRLGQESL
jgi:hypothetical protein